MSGPTPTTLPTDAADPAGAASPADPADPADPAGAAGPADARRPAAAAAGGAVGRAARLALAVLDRPAATLVAAFAVSALCALLLVAALGEDPVFAAQVAVDSTIGTQQGAVDTMVYATPRLLVALGAIVALRGGQFNLGGEGQLQLGAVGAAVGGVYLANVLPGGLHLVAALLVAAMFGAVWAAIAAVLKIWRGADEIVVTLLMNFIATYFVQFLVQGPMKAEKTSFNQSERISSSAELPQLFGTRLHLGFLLALVLAVVVAVLVNRTTTGLRLRAVGHNPLASRYHGVSITRTVLIAMAVSGAIAGLAGASDVLGVQFRLIQGFSSNFGFEGLAIAFLAGLRPGRALVISLVFGGIFSTATQLQQLTGITASLAYVVEALPILLLACAGGAALLRGGRNAA
ncbi:nucleoside ABC transporter membrane protein [Frankia sp. EI5c]|uniref:ABC transporter permease n=1 Tax=Frankia sp. EI5c TaxID=683316 RepID=UPI0007C205A3|nr:ABC transporter permease [Frankia sp. EI5c]OAA25382.1 nucleoside ABC transporter membrane protein [Frankia sp. EI5c]